MDNTRDLYLDIMKRALTNWLYGPSEMRRLVARRPWKKALIALFNCVTRHELVSPCPMIPEVRKEGTDWPPTAHTMIGLKRLDNIQSCIESVIADNVPGDIMECGVWRGGATIFMRAVLKAHGVRDRKVYVADSFRGLPEPEPEKYPMDKGSLLHAFPELSAPLQEVKSNFERYGLLDEQVCFLVGYFKDTLPAAPPERLAVLRLDGDLYGSTMDILTNLYPKLQPGGYLIVDDYNLPMCRKAVDDYRDRNVITEEMVKIDRCGVYWRKQNITPGRETVLHPIPSAIAGWGGTGAAGCSLLSPQEAALFARVRRY